ncbi:HlyD family secretion protein [Roseomonas rosulenta]|uniref:HlyD family secretion protein n=1 Tax=Roseomonas rosulenta TaxID=2748667 RepID=UPI0018E02402|nr:HlyD family secretion protein [Roseomonas rosulenta]
MSSDASTQRSETAVAERPLVRRRWRPGTGSLLVGLFLAVLALHVLFDRVTPYTSEATLQAPVVGVAPNVSGDIVEVRVRDNQVVRAGEILFRINPERFATAVAQAEANLTDASQRVGASTAALSSAEAKVLEARANLANVQHQAARVLELAQRNVYSQAQADTARAQLATAQAAVQTAEAGLEEARTRLGPVDAENPQILLAIAQLRRARIDLADTEVRAQVDGFVTNTVLSPGQFASAGRTVATIIDSESAWVVANLPENTLGNIRAGDRVLIAFNVRPGRIYEGRVESVAAGVAHDVGGTGQLARVLERRKWIRDTQRFPLRIELTDGRDIPAVRVGSRASVVVLTQHAGPVATLARLWLRIVATAN